MEKENPDYWRWGGANGWQNSSLESFLGAALAWFDGSVNRDEIDDLPEYNQWRDFAEFLYCGKVYE
ncbi:DUF7660 family protein [Crinalium epipsammum]|uniref:DUF7660 family protein n=1 Tax=Crinalium epipsammum TaxID=241425 RepID=UPI0003127459|nr:hypothetical protein [Crinalium epipsammum]